MQFIRQYLLAVQFFTRIPITGRLATWVGFSPDLLRASAGHFPGVGLVVGAVAAGVYGAVHAALPVTAFTPLVAAVLSTTASVLLTGGFHEDGLADVADGLGGSYDRARALEIMKDSRVGAFGAMALVLALVTKMALLALLGTQQGLQISAPASLSTSWHWWGFTTLTTGYVCAALVAAHVVSRALPLLLVALLPHVGNSATSKSKPLADRIGTRSLVVAGLWCFMALWLVSIGFTAINLIVACSSSVLALLWLWRWFKRRLQGFTGDCLGAAQQVCEVAFYFGLAASL